MILKILPVLALVGLVGCAGTGTGTLGDGQIDCQRLKSVADAARFRLENPVYLNEAEALLAQRALADAELAVAIAGCTGS